MACTQKNIGDFNGRVRTLFQKANAPTHRCSVDLGHLAEYSSFLQQAQKIGLVTAEQAEGFGDINILDPQGFLDKMLEFRRTLAGKYYEAPSEYDPYYGHYGADAPK